MSLSVCLQSQLSDRLWLNIKEPKVASFSPPRGAGVLYRVNQWCQATMRVLWLRWRAIIAATILLLVVFAIYYSEFRKLTLWPIVIPYADMICVNICSGNSQLTDGTKPLPELILTYHQQSLLAFSWVQFHRNCARYHSLQSVWKWFTLVFENTVYYISQRLMS